MNRARPYAWLFAVSALVSTACGGESSSSDDGGDGDSGGTGGSQGGSTSTGGTAGTGGVPPDGTCDDVMPCGGDPTGTWVINENCLEVVIPDLFAGMPGCEDVAPVGSAALEGTFTFEDGIATQSTQQSVEVTVIIDDACAQGLTGIEGISAVAICPVLDAQLMMSAETPGRCAPAAGGCRCDSTQTPDPTVETDTYQVVGNRLVLGSGDEFDFCQQGDEMRLSGATVDATSGATAEILVLLDRQ